MIAIIAPEAAPWVELVRRAHPTAWILAPSTGRAIALWGRGSTAGRLAARFMVRRALDRLAARLLPDVEEVWAPSVGARRTFAAARARGIRTVLVEDLPALRQLHDDLDRAAAVHPESAFLHNYRAPRDIVARQETERVLADRLLVRGRHAADLRVGLGFADVAALPEAPLRAASRNEGRTVLLAGLAATRHGVLEAIRALPDGFELAVRVGEGTEPADLLSRPRVRSATAAEAQLEGIAAVVAPAWVECNPPEVGAAVARGIPVVATRRAAGWHALTEVEPGDAEGLSEALLAAITPV